MRAERLHPAEDEEVVADLVAVAVPGLVALTMDHLEETLAREVEAEAGIDEILVSVLDVIVSAFCEHEWVDPLQPAGRRVEVDFAQEPRGRESGFIYVCIPLPFSSI